MTTATMTTVPTGRMFTPTQVVIMICCALLCQSFIISIPNLMAVSESITKTTTPAMVFHDDDVKPSTTTTSTGGGNTMNPFDIHIGPTQNLPSIQHTNDTDDNEREKHGVTYGGKGDKKHLGGFTEIDMQGISPAVWKYIVEEWTVQSILDVGCGRGISTSWFYTHGVRTECVEGSHDAITQSMLPNKELITEHDFSRGPWWPATTFDAIWSVEFLEHVNIHNHFNYISTFRKAAILLVTSSHWGGWHHVEVHQDEWWIRKYESYGFKYDAKLTQEIRSVATKEHLDKEIFPPNGKNITAQHVWVSMKVFINPVVAALPQHNHLFGEFGCFNTATKGKRECGKAANANEQHDANIETPLDKSYYPLTLTPQQDEDWYTIVKNNIGS